jgi:hypothetical protein
MKTRCKEYQEQYGLNNTGGHQGNLKRDKKENKLSGF